MYRELVAASEASVVIVECPGSKGSGFLVSRTGHVVTNRHVVADIKLVGGVITVDYSAAISVTYGGRRYPATLVTDPTKDRPVVYDYAILKVDGLNDTPHLHMGDPGSVRRGDDVVCLGFPLDFSELVATHGIVAAVAMRPSPTNMLHQMRTIVTDAVIQFGNSGGPMLHVPSQKVIGINTLKHQIHDAARERLITWCEFGGAAAFPLIRDLANYTMKYTYVGLHHAVSVEHVMADAAWPAASEEKS